MGSLLVTFVFLLAAAAATISCCSACESCEPVQEYTECGGNIIAERGFIRYKHKQTVEPNKGCMWLLRANLKQSVVVRLLDDGFSVTTSIKAYHMTRDGSLESNENWTWRGGDGDRTPRTIAGPVIMLSFIADFFSTNSTGFLLSFDGCGPDLPSPPSYKHFYYERTPESTSLVSYPPGNDADYEPNELVTWLGQRDDRLVDVFRDSDWHINVTYQDLQPSSYCLYGDTLQFYSGGSRMWPAVNKTDYEFIWRFCEKESHALWKVPQMSPKYHKTFPITIGVLAVFNSNGGVQGKGLRFEW